MAELQDDFLEPSLDDLQAKPELVVIDFSATWCGPCKRQDPVFRRVARAIVEDEGDEPVAFLVVDVDRNKALARRYNVKSVPTTIVLARETSIFRGEHWSEKARFSGVVPYPRLREAVDEHVAAVQG